MLHVVQGSLCTVQNMPKMTTFGDKNAVFWNEVWFQEEAEACVANWFLAFWVGPGDRAAGRLHAYENRTGRAEDALYVQRTSLDVQRVLCTVKLWTNSIY